MVGHVQRSVTNAPCPGKKEWVDPSWGNQKKKNKKQKIEEGQNSLVKVIKK